jgi:hypothetical protein
MAIPLCGTFLYVATVSDNVSEAMPWVASMCAPFKRTWYKRRGASLVGFSPRVEINEAGLTPDTRLGAGQKVRPKVLRSSITLRAAEKTNATASAVSFHVDRSLTARLSSGDQLYIARTGCGGLGLSIIRNNQLIVAVGALTAVPLGNNVRVSVPLDLVRQAEAVFKPRDPEFQFPVWPVEVCVGCQRHVRFRGWEQIEGYEVFVEHGFYPGIPGQNECLAISLKGACSVTAANASAQLLDFGDLHITSAVT